MVDLDTYAKNSDLQAVYEISKVLSTSLDLQRSVREVVNLLSAHLHGRAALSLDDPEAGLCIFEAAGLSSEEKARGRFKSGEGITGRILKTGLPMVIPDIEREPLFLHRTGAYRASADTKVAFIGVPVKIGGNIIGVLTVDRSVPKGTHPRFESVVRLLKMVANLIGQTARLHQYIAAERTALLVERNRLQKQLQGRFEIENVVGISREMQQVFADVRQVAQTRSTVLLRGESGTGKEMIARAIHCLGSRRDRPFISLNCAALSETLLESELFGHEKGAFTGATGERKGRFELADGGTLFLDEIGEISPAFQAKLLRVLQEREFERVGGSKSIHVDVRLIFATNRNLEEAVASGEFRADLYYRINVVTLFLPPLRQRHDDIPLLAQHFLEKFNRDNQRRVMLGQDAVRVMLSCKWPGNVRELENCVERAAAMNRGDVIRATDLACQNNRCFSLILPPHPELAARPVSIPVVAAGSPAAVVGDDPESSGEALRGLVDREVLRQALEQCGWVQAKAARMLKLTPRQIGYAIRKHGIAVKQL
jgi:Nif-specific regulatory protein